MRNSLSFLPLASGLLVLVLSLAVAILTVTSKNAAPSQNVTSKASEAISSLALTPDKATYSFSSGQTYTVGIVLDAAGKSVDGTDVVINFDPAKVQIVDSKVSTTTLLEQYPLNSIDNVKGKIRYSGLTFNSKPLTGIIGTFKFRPLGKGEVNFAFDFTSGATTDSNIAEHGTAQDILGKVTNGNYIFQ